MHKKTPTNPINKNGKSRPLIALALITGPGEFEIYGEDDGGGGGRQVGQFG